MTVQKQASQLSSGDTPAVLGMLLLPLLGPMSLRIWGAGGNLEELWAVIFGPIFYLLVGMSVSTLKTARLGATCMRQQSAGLAKRLHDAKVGSLFFLALFEGAACLFAVEPEVPPIVPILASCLYVPYVALAIVWLLYLKRLQIAEQAAGHAA